MISSVITNYFSRKIEKVLLQKRSKKLAAWSLHFKTHGVGSACSKRMYILFMKMK